MKKAKALNTVELRPEYKPSDFKKLVRGKYIERLRVSSNVVVLDPEVVELFPNAAAVNAALRTLAEIANRAGARRGRARGNGAKDLLPQGSMDRLKVPVR
jgi:hypothetical protein